MPIWLLGSSLYSAQLAAHLGLPYAFASHFAPDMLMDALHEYRTGFQPSAQLERPYAMVGLNVVAADTDEEARGLFTSQQQQSTDLIRGKPSRLRPPIDDIDDYWTRAERPHVEHKMLYSVVGSLETVCRGVAGFIEKTGADEIITTVRFYDPKAGLRSLEILAEARRKLAGEGPQNQAPIA